jgi:hypothetical protein
MELLIMFLTHLGHKTVFGNGNVVNGSVGLTSGVALLNKSLALL